MAEQIPIENHWPIETVITTKLIRHRADDHPRNPGDIRATTKEKPPYVNNNTELKRVIK